MTIQPIVVAAGKGTRMKSELPKVLHPIGGLPMINHLISSIRETGFLDPIVVVGYKKEQVIATLPRGIKTVVQKEQIGAGHAVLEALESRKINADAILVLNGDHPFWKAETLKELAKVYANNKTIMAIGIINEDNASTANFGRIVRDSQDRIQKNVEVPDASEIELKITERNPALYLANKTWVQSHLETLSPNPNSGAIEFPSLVNTAYCEGYDIAWVYVSSKEAWGINTQEQLKEAERLYLEQQSAPARV